MIKKLINSIHKSYEDIGILAVNSSYVYAKILKGVNNIYLLKPKYLLISIGVVMLVFCLFQVWY